MDATEMIVDRLEHLHLDFCASEIGAWALKEKADDEALASILSFVETMAAKADRKAQEMMTRLSRLPQKNPKLFSSFDTSRLPDDSRKAVRNLETLSFIPACRNIIMVGPTGTGKTHLAEAIGNECCRRRMRTYFIKMQELKDRFRSSIISGSAGRLLSGFLKYQCIIIDEVGYCTLDKDETRLFFQMVDRLSTRGSGSVILTSTGMCRNGRNSSPTWMRLNAPWTGCATTRSASRSQARATGKEAGLLSLWISRARS